MWSFLKAHFEVNCYLNKVLKKSKILWNSYNHKIKNLFSFQTHSERLVGVEIRCRWSIQVQILLLIRSSWLWLLLLLTLSLNGKKSIARILWKRWQESSLLLSLLVIQVIFILWNVKKNICQYFTMKTFDI